MLILLFHNPPLSRALTDRDLKCRRLFLNFELGSVLNISFGHQPVSLLVSLGLFELSEPLLMAKAVIVGPELGRMALPGLLGGEIQEASEGTLAAHGIELTLHILLVGVQVDLLPDSQPLGLLGTRKPVGAVALGLRELCLDHALQLVLVPLQDLLLLGGQPVFTDTPV